jgi:DNA-3-methyladenine glycosylase I
MTGYCLAVHERSCNEVHFAYHNEEYGFPVGTDNGLFERLILEINQAGLSWETVLKKREGFKAAYQGFDIDRVASFDQADIDRILGDPSVIRNRAKVLAAISNAKVVQELQQEHGSFAAWLDLNLGLDLADWVKLFRRTFKFTGPEVVREFLVSTGYLPGAHDEDCPVYDTIISAKPRWGAS